MASVASRQVVSPAYSRSGWRLAGAALDRWADTLRSRGEALGLGGPDWREPGGAIPAVVEACLAAGSDRRSLTLAELLVDLYRFADDRAEWEAAGLTLRLAACSRSLDELRGITTTSSLIDGVCDVLVSYLGFERTMLARVESGLWRPWKANTSMLSEPWVADWIDGSIPLDELTLETRLLSERRPARIRDTNVAGMAQMVRAAGVTSYVVAPIMPGDQVVGFFHADHGARGRECSDFDRDLLWLFAEGFARIYERTALLEQLESRREQVRATMAELERDMADLVPEGMELRPDTGGALVGPEIAPGAVALSDRLARLTPRELEILDLVVAGARNNEIAERLVVTLGTVKTHIGRILFKLGARNRSQVIALYLRADPPGGPRK